MSNEENDWIARCVADAAEQSRVAPAVAAELKRQLDVVFRTRPLRVSELAELVNVLLGKKVPLDEKSTR
jgi:hypothetical protein